MSIFGEERPHAATAVRLKRAREDGDSAHSHELAFAIQMVAGLGALWFSLATIGRGLKQATLGYWSNHAINGSSEAIIQSSQSMLWATLRLILPVLVAIFVIGALAHLLQTRFLINRPKLSVGGQSWFSSVFSFEGMASLTITAPKILIGLGAGGLSIWAHRASIFSLGGMPTDALAASLSRIIGASGLSVAVSLLACSVFDYGMQWYRFHQRNRLTDQEMREELRGQTGDPQIAKIRHQRMREMTYEGKQVSR